MCSFLMRRKIRGLAETPRGNIATNKKKKFIFFFLAECIFKGAIYHNNQPGFLPSACLRPCGLEIWSLVRKEKAVCKISGVFFPGKGERTKAEIYDIHFMPYKESIHLSLARSLYLSLSVSISLSFYIHI